MIGRLCVAALMVAAIVAAIGGLLDSLALVGVAIALAIAAAGVAPVAALRYLNVQRTRLRRDLATVADGVEELNAKLEDVAASLDRLQRAQGGMVETIGQRVDAIGQRVDAIGERVDAIGERVDGSVSTVITETRTHVDTAADRAIASSQARAESSKKEVLAELRDLLEVQSVPPVSAEAVEKLQESLDQQDPRLRWLQRNLSVLTRYTRNLPADVQAVVQLLSQHPPTAPLPHVGGWAMEPPALLWLVDTVVRRRPRLVVECGSGTSTLWIARALQECGGGRVVSFEHESEYLEKTKALLADHGVLEYVDLRHAPLVDTATPRGNFSWYDVSTDGLDEIDLLLVDGPPGTTGPHARYPALPVLGDKLAPDAVVIVDDVSRKDEQEMVSHWLEERPELARLRQLGINAEALIRR
jgi:predicted O-methyltransferase YrrM